MHESRGLDLAHLAWQQRKRGMMADSQWKKVMWSAEHFGQRQATQAAWTVYRDSYDPAFRVEMEPYLAEGGR